MALRKMRRRSTSSRRAELRCSVPPAGSNRQPNQRAGPSRNLGQKLSAEDGGIQADRPQPRRQHHAGGGSADAGLIDNCLQYHADYLQIPEAGSSFVNRDFMAARLEPDEIQALLQPRRTITQSTLLEQLEAGEVLGDDFDVEEELEGTRTAA